MNPSGTEQLLSRIKRFSRSLFRKYVIYITSMKGQYKLFLRKIGTKVGNLSDGRSERVRRTCTAVGDWAGPHCGTVQGE
jgi:hypothetical protein